VDSGGRQPETTLAMTTRVAGERPAGAGSVQAGDVLAGRYVIEQPIGRGGRGTVYRAFDRGTESWVAIKVLGGDLGDPRELFRELRCAREIQHPNVCRIYEVVEDDERAFLTMELARQGTLGETIRGASAEYSTADRLGDIRAVIAGLAAIHRAGVVHRDLKPDNVLRMSDGRLVLSDFGLARRADQSHVTADAAGTPGYLAPELLSGSGKPTTASDVWALGIVVRAIATGDREVERATRRLVESSLRLDPTRRPVDATVAQSRWPLANIRRRWPSVAAVAAASAFALLATGMWWARRNGDDDAPLAADAQDWRQSKVLIDVSNRFPWCLSALPPDRRRVRLYLGRDPEVLEIDTTNGQVSRPALAPELDPAQILDCPDLAPDGRGLLWSRTVGDEEREVRFSEFPDGRNGRVLLRGSSPRWVAPGKFVFITATSRLALGDLNGQSVLFEADPVQTGTFHMLEANRAGRAALISFPAAKEDSGRIDVYDVPGLRRIARHPTPTTLVGALAFHPDTGALQISVVHKDGDRPEIQGRWAQIGDGGRMHAVAHFDGASIRAVTYASTGVVLHSKEVRGLLLEGGENPSVRLPAVTPGTSFDVGAQGDVVYTDRDGSSNSAIVLRRSGGQVVKLTQGQIDLDPDISDDGRWVTFIRKARAIVHCAVPSDEDPRCRVILDGVAPTGSRTVRVSPDGRHVAFVDTEAGSGAFSLRVLSSETGQVKDLGRVGYVCKLQWGGPGRIWYVNRSPRQWVEVDASTGRPTGRAGEVGRDDEVCSSRPPGVSEPRYRVRADVVEQIRLFASRRDRF
jgi:serine/threonine protein kinase